MMKQVYMQSNVALGTEIELRLVTTDIERAEHIFKILWKEVYDFENRFSRFKIDSELTNLNKNAGKTILASKELANILRTSKEFSILTNGTFNPFILPELQRVGYIRSMTSGNNQQPIDYSKRKIVTFDNLRIENDTVFIPENTALDFGGIGKGYLADLLAKLLQESVGDYCLSLGGDIICRGLNVDKNWEIDIQSNLDRNKNIATYSDGKEIYAVATSALTRNKEGKEQSHLINPKNTPMQNEFEMCSVVAKDATTADVMASCILIDGKNLASELIRHNIIKAVLLQGKALPAPIVLGNGFKLK